MTTIKAQWENFKSKVYRNGMVPEQERQIKDAFYAGADVAFEQISYASSKKTEDEAFAILNGFMAEIAEHAGSIASRGKKN